MSNILRQNFRFLSEMEGSAMPRVIRKYYCTTLRAFSSIPSGISKRKSRPQPRHCGNPTCHTGTFVSGQSAHIEDVPGSLLQVYKVQVSLTSRSSTMAKRQLTSSWRRRPVPSCRVYAGLSESTRRVSAVKHWACLVPLPLQQP